MNMPDLQKIKREAVKGLLAPLVRWKPLAEVEPGYSIVLGTPWALRRLLRVNLRFIAKADLSRLHRLYVVFDRVHQPEAEDFVAQIREAFPDLPLAFAFHPPLAGRVVQRVNQSKFYASLNWVTGLGLCRTRYAVLHDFDLYPLRSDFFERIVSTMEREGLCFSGSEYTQFDGLNDHDGLIGTWELGIDVQWLREHYRPVACFHAVRQINGRRVDLDAFSAIQARTPRRGLASELGPDAYGHVKNLCSTYLRFHKGERVDVAWRLHYLWYLESLAGSPELLGEVTEKMRQADSPRLAVGEAEAEFADTHVTCANVLRNDLVRMDTTLYGKARPEVEAYLDAFQGFLERHGNNQPLETASA